MTFPGLRTPRVGPQIRLAPSRPAGSPFDDLAYADYIQSEIAPILWLRFRETAGLVAVNSGSGGAALNGAITAATLGQPGGGNQGANEAYLFDGATSLIALPANASVYDSLTRSTVAVLVKMASAGEASYGRFWGIGKGVLCYCQFNGAMTAVISSADTDATDAVTATSAGINTNWVWIFRTYDNTGDRKVHLYKGQLGHVSEFAYASQVAATGILVSVAADPLAIGNSVGAALTVNGLFDEFLIAKSVLSLAQMQSIVSLTGI